VPDLVRRDAEAHGTTVKVTAVSEPVQRVLQITGLFARSWATIRSSDLRRHNSSLVCGGYVREGAVRRGTWRAAPSHDERGQNADECCGRPLVLPPTQRFQSLSC
jgi:hypothetical protein